MTRFTREIPPIQGTYLDLFRGKEGLRDYLGRCVHSSNDTMHITSVEQFMSLGAVIYGNALTQNKEWMEFALPIATVEISLVVKEIEALSRWQGTHVTFGQSLDTPYARILVKRLPLRVGIIDPGGQSLKARILSCYRTAPSCSTPSRRV